MRIEYQYHFGVGGKGMWGSLIYGILTREGLGGRV